MGTRYETGDILTEQNTGREGYLRGIEYPDSDSPTYVVRFLSTNENKKLKASELKKTGEHFVVDEIVRHQDYEFPMYIKLVNWDGNSPIYEVIPVWKGDYDRIDGEYLVAEESELIETESVESEDEDEDHPNYNADKVKKGAVEVWNDGKTRQKGGGTGPTTYRENPDGSTERIN